MSLFPYLSLILFMLSLSLLISFFLQLLFLYLSFVPRPSFLSSDSSYTLLFILRIFSFLTLFFSPPGMKKKKSAQGVVAVVVAMTVLMVVMMGAISPPPLPSIVARLDGRVCRGEGGRVEGRGKGWTFSLKHVRSSIQPCVHSFFVRFFFLCFVVVVFFSFPLYLSFIRCIC